MLDANTYELVSTIRPKEELGVELADHIHNTVWYEHGGQLYLICQAWIPDTTSSSRTSVKSPCGTGAAAYQGSAGCPGSGSIEVGATASASS